VGLHGKNSYFYTL